MDTYILPLRNGINLYKSALHYTCSGEEVASGVSGWSVWLLVLWLACEVRDGEPPASFQLQPRSHSPEIPLCLAGSVRTKQSLGTGWAPFAQARGLQKRPSSRLILLFQGCRSPVTAEFPEPGLGSTDVLYFFLCRSLLKCICYCAMPKPCSLNYRFNYCHVKNKEC